MGKCACVFQPSNKESETWAWVSLMMLVKLPEPMQLCITSILLLMNMYHQLWYSKCSFDDIEARDTVIPRSSQASDPDTQYKIIIFQ